jgi:hypothetical protein
MTNHRFYETVYYRVKAGNLSFQNGAGNGLKRRSVLWKISLSTCLLVKFFLDYKSRKFCSHFSTLITMRLQTL